MNNCTNLEYSSEKLDKTASNVVKLLLQRGWHVAFAESCTGGLLSQTITSVPGASAVYELGICTYANRIKNKFLGVPNDMLDSFGAVSPEVALAMVSGLSRCSDAEICVSVTGIAGPDGGTPEKPVGTVWFGFYVNGKTFRRLPELWLLKNKSRGNIRLAAANYAFGIIEEILTEDF